MIQDGKPWDFGLVPSSMLDRSLTKGILLSCDNEHEKNLDKDRKS
jgi:hypothetical protein